MTCYKTERYSTEIRAIEVEKFTKHFAYVVSEWGTKRSVRRQALNSEWGDIFATRQEAVGSILARLTLAVGRCESQLQLAKNTLAKFKQEEQQQ